MISQESPSPVPEQPIATDGCSVQEAEDSKLPEERESCGAPEEQDAEDVEESRLVAEFRERIESKVQGRGMREVLAEQVQKLKDAPAAEEARCAALSPSPAQA